MSGSLFPIELSAGRHARNHCPVLFTPEELPGEAPTVLISEDGKETPLQMLGDGSAAILLEQANPLQNCRYRYGAMKESMGESSPGMRIVQGEKSTMAILQDGELITEYCYDDVYARPFFYPVNEPGGRCVTRSYPMRAIAHETSDHPHHKSLWCAHGDVNGVDNWSEESGHGHTRHQSTDAIEEGPVLARFHTTSVWTDADDNSMLTQYLIATFWRSVGTACIMDFEIRLAANIVDDDLIFGDTKEGGILSVRVASSMDATHGGTISNVYGGQGEAECWGKNSHWCSYTGVVDHQPCGIAVFDHPDGFRSPTPWHVRDYGLMTANPFGYAAFTHGRIDGAAILTAGDELTFKYRVIAHSDPDFNTTCSARYIDYAFPPRVRHLHHVRR